MPRYRISHHTLYRYGAPVIQSQHALRLSPRLLSHQSTNSHELKIEPTPAWRDEREDYFGNATVLIGIEAEHRELTVTATSDIVVTQPPKPDPKAATPWSPDMVYASRIAEFTFPSPHVPITADIAGFAKPSFGAEQTIIGGATDVMRRIYRDFKFDNQATDISTPISQVLTQRSGVCQDFVHLMIGALRSMGVPARYMSGYILTHPPEGQPKLEGTDASHAWVAAWDPAFGWVEFDPTNDLVNSDEHIAIAYGRDFDDVSPLSGVLLGGGSHTVTVGVDVREIEPESVAHPVVQARTDRKTG